jgi:hypothetical protein
MPEKIMVDELAAAGFHLKKTIDDWSGSDYCVILQKTGS